MNSKLAPQYDQQAHQHPHLDLQGAFDPSTEEGIVKGLTDLLIWTPFTNVGYSVITQALVLIEHLKNSNKEIAENPYLKLREFGARMLSLLATHGSAQTKDIFFYDYPANEVYLGIPGDLDRGIDPMVVKATLGTDAVTRLSLEEALEATKRSTDIIQSRVFGRPLNRPVTSNPEVDWEFTLMITDNPLEWEFKAAFEEGLIKAGYTNPGYEWGRFKDKFNVSAVLNDPSRPLMDFHIWSANQQLHWEWVMRK